MFDDLTKKIYSNEAYFGGLEVLEYIIFIIIIYKYNPFSIKTAYPAFTNILTLIIGLIYVILFYFIREGKTNIPLLDQESNFLIKLLSTIAFFIISVFLTKHLITFLLNHSVLSLVRYGILGLIIIIILTIVYYVFEKNFEKAEKASGASIMAFISKFIMFLPCLLLQFINFIKYQYNITTKPIWILLLSEIILIILWLIIPLLLNAYSTNNGIQLLKEPEYLNKEIVLGTYNELYGKGIDPLGSGESYRSKFSYHYSLSAWFNINPQPPNTSPAYNKYTTILSYGSKPAVEFNGKLNTLRVIVESDTEPGQKKKVVIYKTNKILFQKWNNIVINYDHGTMDVFINGELVGSRPGIAPYMTFENIKVGSPNGIHGGISNVMYFKDNLSRSYIEMMYIALRGKVVPFF